MIRRPRLLLLGLAAWAWPATAAPPADLTLELVTTASSPVAVRHAGDGSGRLFVVERAGVIRVFAGGVLLAEPFLDISSKVTTDGELGLLGLAFHPDYAQNGYFYVSYGHSTPARESFVERYSVSAGDPNRADPASALVILTVAQDQLNHNGGDLHFSPRDGYLYFGLGDGGGGGDPLNRAQDLGVLLGKMLRLDVDGASPYAVPPSNPFTGDGGARDEIWAWGLRNPYRFSFDRLTGDLWIADVGQDAVEEVDFQPAASAGGENYGWDCFEGSVPYTDANSGTVCSGPLVDPVLEYSHDLGCSVTGGFRYRGHRIASFRGTYVYADFCTNRVWFAVETSPGVFTSSQWTGNTASLIAGFGEDEAGELYVVSLGGQIRRFTSPSSIFTDGFESGGVAAWSVVVSP